MKTRVLRWWFLFWGCVCVALPLRANEEVRTERLPGAEALKRAIQDLTQNYASGYPRGPEWLKQVEALERQAATAAGDESNRVAQAFKSLRREALLANPLIDFDRLLVIRRKADNLALPQNWESNSSISRNGVDNELLLLEDLRQSPRLQPLYKPAPGRFVGDLALHFDAERLMFSSPDDQGRWGVFEMGLDGGVPRPLSLIPDPDVDNYTAIYLADDSILFTSTAPFVGVPCVRGSSHVAHLYRYWPSTGKIRRLTFDQEHNWCPTLMPDGRVLYLRWEYSDLPHYVARILFTMKPDGTDQKEFYGSGSYWPNAFFYAKPMPGHPGQVAGIVGGHHGVPRMGELVIIEPARGRFEADGVVQRIPGYGKKVEPIIRDQLVDESWPKFLHPTPLSDKYLLVACKPEPNAQWGLYLADVFDNLLLLKEEPGYALFEPIPLRKTPRPPVIPDTVKEGETTARMQIVDIYQGPGLREVPRGVVKKLRLFTYDFAYHNMGGQWDRVGLDGPWDIKRIMGTVPVEADGSANFEVPANLPISIQPLDAQGRAVALMRSWATAMPGELLSCVGCHEMQNNAPPPGSNLALRRPPSKIEPFYGPMRGFHFDREVQPVLDRYCIACHDGRTRPEGAPLPDFRRGENIFAGEKEVKFPPAYVALKAYVRNPTAENDMHMLLPCEFHASTTELVQILEAGHYGVKLDAEAWDRLNTWIDLNTPAWGTWTEMLAREGGAAGQRGQRIGKQPERRRELALRYAGLNDDNEAVYPGPNWKPEPPPAQPKPLVAARPECAGWPFDAAEARRRQAAGGGPVNLTLDLGDGVNLKLTRIPAGRFVAGGGASRARVVEIPRAFWMSDREISNEQFRRFNARHDSRIEHERFLQFSVAQRGQSLDDPNQPVCHVSWNEASAYCQWLAARTGRTVALPSGEAWEYACRAGTATPMFYGAVEADFSRFANLADLNLRRPKNYDSGTVPEWRPAVITVDDGFWVSAPVGTYQPNAWGLSDMVGNVWEWTTDRTSDGAGRLARGGSWSVRPARATADASVAYPPWQKVYDVGFRVVINET